MQRTCSHMHRSISPAPLSSDGSCFPLGPGGAQYVLVVLVPGRTFCLWICLAFGLVLELGAAKAKSWDNVSCPSVTWEEGEGRPHQKDLACFNLAFLRQIQVFSEIPSEPASWVGGGSEQIRQVRRNSPVARGDSVS